MFYARKAAARCNAFVKTNHAALAFNFAKNMSSPSVSTNDVYYCRQLSMNTFNIHSLGSDNVHLFCNDETYGKKRADNVASMLQHYFDHILPRDVSHLELFCNSCAGQNKNWTIIHFLHFNVVNKKHFLEINLSFSIRIHSYMECDSDMALVNQKVLAEIPERWMEEFCSCCKKPSPSEIIKMELNRFLNISEHIKPYYKASCPIHEIIFSQDFPHMLNIDRTGMDL